MLGRSFNNPIAKNIINQRNYQNDRNYARQGLC